MANEKLERGVGSADGIVAILFDKENAFSFHLEEFVLERQRVWISPLMAASLTNGCSEDASRPLCGADQTCETVAIGRPVRSRLNALATEFPN
jgi:hypothetical protein